MTACSGGQAGNRSCVAEGAQVLTPKGLVFIEQLAIGDLVFSVDPETGCREATRLVGIRTARRPCLLFTTVDGEQIRATAEHPFLSPETGAYERADAWQSGRLSEVYRHTVDGELLRVEVSSCVPLAGELQVFDLSVSSEFHNFVADGFVVHNKSEGNLVIEGHWQGVYVSQDEVLTGLLTMNARMTDWGLSLAEIEFDSQACLGKGSALLMTRGAARGTIEFEDGSKVELVLGAKRDAKGAIERLVGSYQVKTGAGCMHENGTIELQEVVGTTPVKSLQTEFTVLRVDREGVQEVARGVTTR